MSIGIVRSRETDDGGGTEEYDWRCDNCIDFAPVWGMDGEGSARYANTACTYCGKPIFTDRAGFHLELTSNECGSLITALATDIKDWQQLLSKDLTPRVRVMGEKCLKQVMDLHAKVQNTAWTV